LNLKQHSPAGGNGQFHATRWSAALLSAQRRAPGSQAALAELCTIYWYPIYTFIRRRGPSPEDAQDLTQGFFLHLLDHRTLSQVSPVKGKFSSFLLASLQNHLSYLSDEADRARFLKRGGNIKFVPLDMGFAETRYRLGPLDFLTANKVFDARWAMTLPDEAMDLLRKEYAGQGKTFLFETLTPFIDPINSKAALSYERVAETLRVRVGTVKKPIFRLRKRYASVLREEVARTVSDSGEVDEEIHSLCEVLILTEGRLGL
jgi:DNA-directed RNA polymerase specialized sigma24 family protein